MNLDPKTLDDLARRLSEALPPGLAAVRDDLERNFRAVLQAGLARLDLVTRKEFDVQAWVLQKMVTQIFSCLIMFSICVIVC